MAAASAGGSELTADVVVWRTERIAGHTRRVWSDARGGCGLPEPQWPKGAENAGSRPIIEAALKAAGLKR